MQDEQRLPGRDALCFELATVIETGLQQLDEPERITLILGDMHGVSCSDIARLTCISPR